MNPRLIAHIAGSALIAVLAAASAANASAGHPVPAPYVQCRYGPRFAEIVPDGTGPGTEGWCRVVYDLPTYKGQFTIVAPSGARETYRPAGG